MEGTRTSPRQGSCSGTSTRGFPPEPHGFCGPELQLYCWLQAVMRYLRRARPSGSRSGGESRSEGPPCRGPGGARSRLAGTSSMLHWQNRRNTNRSVSECGSSETSPKPSVKTLRSRVSAPLQGSGRSACSSCWDERLGDEAAPMLSFLHSLGSPSSTPGNFLGAAFTNSMLRSPIFSIVVFFGGFLFSASPIFSIAVFFLSPPRSTSSMAVHRDFDAHQSPRSTSSRGPPRFRC